MMSLQIATLCGYLLGSIPFGLVLTRIAGLGDIRKIGSGNIGATNVLRTGNKFLALLTLIGDVGKGAAAVLLFTHYVSAEAGIFAGGAAVVGHMLPVWLRFKGGKGVATTLGTLIAVNWIMGLVAAATWLVMALIFRISSLSALIAMIAAPIAAFVITNDPGAGWLAIFLAVIVWAAHHANIRRLIKGEEPKIGQKKKDEVAANDA
ncbi:glycerol-3-phosphate acyltransferase [Thalassospira alkalitolerans]|uniref:Glycerol-3-phosphate acyltransferase n=1 Tax=Thalassospira alkalitolerans TaxID=1293890 RepID=A0A1Y2L992_9PROT|nr:glycerol-3-phosphate acyltransferase [Thalassospira alkalitolerans]